MRLKLLGVVLLAALCLSPLYGTEVLYPDPDGGGGGGGGCWKECYTTCTGPAGVECCCYYHCPSGISYGCTNSYCPETSRSCGL
jgi:hypothetical protein